MLKIRSRPYNLIFLVALANVLLSIIPLNQKNTIDIHVHDTYFVIAHFHILWLLAIIALIVWAIYILTKRILLSKVLIWTHVIVTVLPLILLTWLLFFGNNFFNPGLHQYVDFSTWTSFESHDTYSKAIIIIVFVLLLGQLVYVINFIGGVFKRWI